MSELYTGQAAIVAAKLDQSKILQDADNARLEAATDAQSKETILRRMASRRGQIAAYQRTLDACTDGETVEEQPTDRDHVIKFRVNQVERETLSRLAADAGQTLSEYIRLMCGV